MSKHTFTAQVTERDESGIATRWRGRCARHGDWSGTSYEEIEDAWRRHVYHETGKVPTIRGDKANRWAPA